VEGVAACDEHLCSVRASNGCGERRVAAEDEEISTILRTTTAQQNGGVLEMSPGTGPSISEKAYFTHVPVGLRLGLKKAISSRLVVSYSE
jgi:hypothetical protein